jgi:hypothetical protein
MKRYGWLIALAIALALAVLSPLASPHPDGLERVAQDQGFGERAQAPHLRIISDYLFPGIHNEALATILSGMVGVLLTFGLMFGLARLVARRR